MGHGNADTQAIELLQIEDRIVSVAKTELQTYYGKSPRVYVTARNGEYQDGTELEAHWFVNPNETPRIGDEFRVTVTRVVR